MELDVDQLIVLSNVALVLVTALAVWVTLRESHRHEETTNAANEREQHDLASLVHEVLQQEKLEHEHDNATHEDTTTK